jgi:hypothetical protein
MAYGWRAFERLPGLAMHCRQPQASSPDLQVAVTGRSATNSESHGYSWAASLTHSFANVPSEPTVPPTTTALASPETAMARSGATSTILNQHQTSSLDEA